MQLNFNIHLCLHYDTRWILIQYNSKKKLICSHFYHRRVFAQLNYGSLVFDTDPVFHGIF